MLLKEATQPQKSARLWYSGDETHTLPPVSVTLKTVKPVSSQKVLFTESTLWPLLIDVAVTDTCT